MLYDHRPASILAKTLKLEQLGLFVQLRALALADDPVEVAALEKSSGTSQADAVSYFLHVHDWQEPSAEQQLRDETIAREIRTDAIKKALRASLNQPLIRFPSEA